jgi:hypothetical protein
MVEVDGARAVAHGRSRLYLTGRLHLRPLDEEGGAREELVAPAMVEVKVRVDHVADLVGHEAEQGELAHHLVGRRGAQGEAGGAALPQATHGIGEGLAMDAGVHEDVALRVGDEEADHRYGGARAGGLVAEEAAQIQIDEAAAQGIDAGHEILTFAVAGRALRARRRPRSSVPPP